MLLFFALISHWRVPEQSIVDELIPELEEVGKKAQQPYCISLAWSADGATLYSGYTDGQIRVWTVGHAN